MSPVARRINKSGRLQWSKPTIWKGLALFAIILVAALLVGMYHAGESGFHIPGTPHKTKPAAAKPKTPTPQPDAALNQIITTWAAQHSFSSTVVVRELTGNLRTANYNSTNSVVPASTYKIYVAYAVLHAVEQGSYTLATVTSDGHSIQTDLSNMILNSDNAAARTLGFLIGWKNINALLQTQGLTATDLYNYIPPSTNPVGDKHTTSTDIAIILGKLYSGTLLNTTNTQLLLGLMEQQHYRERIPSGVPAGIVVADKPGWLTGNDDGTTVVQNDAAIVYGPKSTYILVITTTGSTTKPLADLSKLVYDYLEI